MFPNGKIKFVGFLQIHPEVWRHAKKTGQAQRCIRGDIAFAGHNLRNAIRHNPDSRCQGRKTHCAALEAPHQNDAGVDWCALVLFLPNGNFQSPRFLAHHFCQLGGSAAVLGSWLRPVLS